MRIIAALLLVAGLTRAETLPSVRLAWYSGPSGYVDHYTVYYGSVSRQYTASNNVGKVLGATITLPARNGTVYLAVTATGENGKESAFSNEVTYTVTNATGNVRITIFVERANAPSGPWLEAGTVATIQSQPGFYRARLAIDSGPMAIAQKVNLPPIPKK